MSEHKRIALWTALMVCPITRPPSSHRLNHDCTEGVMSSSSRKVRRGISMADHWVENHKRDSWRRQAKASGYRARSAFKLKQIQAKFELMREGDVVLDVGCHPGGWAQVAVEEVGETGIVVGIDLEPCQPVDGALLMVGDITDSLTQERIVKELGDRQVNSVISDISPDITGKWDVDQAVAMTLVAKVFDFALPLLCSGGWFVTKLFQGVGVEELIEAVKPHFSYVRRFSPEASRNSSSEVYLICRNHTPWNAKSTSVLNRYEQAVNKILGGDDIIDDVVATKTSFTVRRKKTE
ncbi:MAG: hypothetical protein CMA41_03435 [Euryarchaeota archaeon]|jgi:23S rRNA (uridine2552-2'-O)-methyltransferase|nr:hypothetical protein [Euryarchaeota archaeon]